MQFMEILVACPICNSEAFTNFLTCMDNTVSHETFVIVQCSSCGFKFTNPRPVEIELKNYYKSENYISHSNTKQGLINYTYQIVRKYTLFKKLQLITTYIKSGSILDIGCGTGEFLNVCQQSKWTTLGIEPSNGARKMAINTFGLEVREESELSKLESESFDVITLWHVLEHVPQLNARIKELKRLIKPTGIIIIAVPNCNSLDAKLYGNSWAAYDVPRHLYHFTPHDIESLFKKHEIKLFRVLPMVFDSFYVCMLSEKIKTGKTNIIKALWNGFRSNMAAIKTGKTYSSQIYLLRK